jgi:hypothetical protein
MSPCILVAFYGFTNLKKPEPPPFRTSTQFVPGANGTLDHTGLASDGVAFGFQKLFCMTFRFPVRSWRWDAAGLHYLQGDCSGKIARNVHQPMDRLRSEI